jgi:hypothetical protein
MFTKSHNCNIASARANANKPSHPISQRFISILSPNLCLVLPKFSKGFPPQLQFYTTLSHPMLTIYPSHLILLHLINQMSDEKIQKMKVTIMYFSSSSSYSSFLDSNTPLSTPFSNASIYVLGLVQDILSHAWKRNNKAFNYTKSDYTTKHLSVTI